MKIKYWSTTIITAIRAITVYQCAYVLYVVRKKLIILLCLESISSAVFNVSHIVRKYVRKLVRPLERSQLITISRSLAVKMESVHNLIGYCQEHSSFVIVCLFTISYLLYYFLFVVQVRILFTLEHILQ